MESVLIGDCCKRTASTEVTAYRGDPTRSGIHTRNKMRDDGMVI